MFKFETVNELYLRATCENGQGKMFSKAGAYIAGQGQYKFEKVLLGPQSNPVGALLGQIGRRITGENLPLMLTKPQGQSITMYADEARHVTVIDLQPGMSLKVESEDLLAFNEECKYGFTVLAQGVISQKGFFTSELTCQAHGAQAAILTNGNPLVLQTPCKVDPDAVVAWTGPNPGFKLDIGWKNLIGQASGESYYFDFNQPGYQVIVQPFERKSGLDLGIDGHGHGNQPQMQQNQSLQGAMGNVSDTLGGLMGGGQPGQPNAAGGLGGIIGQFLR